MRMCVHFPFSMQIYGLVGTYAGLVHAVTVSVSCVSKCCCFLGVIYHFWLLYFQPPLLHTPLILEWRGLIKTSRLGSKYSKVSPSMQFVHLWVSVLNNACCKKTLFWWGFSNDLIYGYSDTPLGVVSLLCTFSRIIVVDFLLSLWFIYYQVVGHFYSTRYGFHLMQWTFKPITVWSVISTIFVTVVYPYNL